MFTEIDFKVIEKERRKGEPPELVADFNKIKSRLNWKYLNNDL